MGADMKKLQACILIMFTMLASELVFASDAAKEKRWADQIVDSIITGEAVWLKAGGHKFLGIYTESEGGKSFNGAIVVHGIGVHPNWADVVYPIRTKLPEAGWHTLSLQMPILPNEAKEVDYKPLFPEVAPRINAGIEFLKKKGVKNIVIIAHSMGSAMAGHYMATNPKADIKALVAIGAAGLHFKDNKLDFVQSIKKIKKPIYDISGSEDSPDVLKTKQLKADTAREAGNKNYQQFEIKGANHFLVGKESELVSTILESIDKYAGK